jgi:hypothetical protein
MRENNGFQEAPWTIYPLRLYRWLHDESKMLACIDTETPLRAGPGRFGYSGKMACVD